MVDSWLWRIARDAGLQWVVEVVAREVEVEEVHEEVDGRWDLTEEVNSVVGGQEDRMGADGVVVGGGVVQWWEIARSRGGR